MPEEPKAFGRYHDVMIMLIGFTLTTVVGGLLSYSWQEQAAGHAREAEQRRFEQNAATDVFEELSRLMDRRLYRMRRLHTGMADPHRDPATMRPRWDAYREVLFEWNENLNRNLALTQRYFGEDARTILEKEINEGFRRLGSLLEGSGYPDGIQSPVEYRQTVADDLNDIIYEFDVNLIESIQSGSVGSFQETN